MTKVHFETYLFEETVTKFLREYRETIAFFLRVVHRDIGVAKYLFGRVIFGVAGSDADVHVARDIVAAQSKRLSDVLVNTARDFLRLTGGRKVAQHDRKFVSADPGHDIVRSQHPHESLGGDRQNFVADRMSERVVDVLKTANVDKQTLEGR